MKDISKPMIFLKKYKELVDLRDSMTQEEIEMLMCGLELSLLQDKYPNINIIGVKKCTQ